MYSYSYMVPPWKRALAAVPPGQVQKFIHDENQELQTFQALIV